MKILIFTLLLIPILCSKHSLAEEISGEKLVGTNCQNCHDNSIYTRSNSILQSYPELQARVEFCESMSNAHWNDQQINQVIEYLNDNYYKFPKP